MTVYKVSAVGAAPDAFGLYEADTPEGAVAVQATDFEQLSPMLMLFAGLDPDAEHVAVELEAGDPLLDPGTVGVAFLDENGELHERELDEHLKADGAVRYEKDPSIGV